MGGLGHYLEAAGIATTQISLIRPHTEALRPPRALWVPFDFGRPLGAPNDAALQTRVLRAALDLLGETDLPVLRDYPEDAPPAATPEGWACPIQLPPPTTGDDAIDALLDELRLLRPWYDEFAKSRGHSSVGVSGGGVERIEEMAEILGRVAAGGDVSADGFAQPHPVALKYIADDLRAFYTEATLAQPGPQPTPQQLSQWLFHETRLGETILRAAARLAALPPELNWLARTMVPEEFLPEIA